MNEQREGPPLKEIVEAPVGSRNKQNDVSYFSLRRPSPSFASPEASPLSSTYTHTNTKMYYAALYTTPRYNYDYSGKEPNILKFKNIVTVG